MRGWMGSVSACCAAQHTCDSRLCTVVPILSGVCLRLYARRPLACVFIVGPLLSAECTTKSSLTELAPTGNHATDTRAAPETSAGDCSAVSPTKSSANSQHATDASPDQKAKGISLLFLVQGGGGAYHETVDTLPPLSLSVASTLRAVA